MEPQVTNLCHRGGTRTVSVLALLAVGCLPATHLASAPIGAANTEGPRGPRPAIRAEASRWGSLTDERAVDPHIPRPASVIGHPVGTKAARYEPMVQYLHALAEASPRVTLTPYATSHEGRTLYYVTITSRANHARLQAIQKDNAALADPRLLHTPEEGERIVETLPGIAWLAYGIHGDELSSGDAALEVAYRLAAGTDPETHRLRDELVIHIDPLMNPDGRERYLGQLQHLTGKVPNPDYQALQHFGLWSAGRGNHYLFDLNRDWLMQVHPETRGRAAVILSWNPHLLVDAHEMSGLDTYLFDPPREPHNVSLSAANMKWRRRFSADQAEAFDRFGWSYYTQEWYEEWYPGYTNAWGNLLGAVGLLYEQARVNAASIKQAAGTTMTYPEAVRHQFVSSLANLETLRANRLDILRDLLADRRWAVSEQNSGREVFLLPPCSDGARLRRLTELLIRQGIETATAGAPLDAYNVVSAQGEKSDTKTLPAGTLVVRSTQPHRRLLHALLDFDPHMSKAFLTEERKELENHRSTRVYDVTAWNLAMAYGLEAYWAASVSDAALNPDPPLQELSPRPTGKPTYGYLIDGASSNIYRAILRLFDRDCRVRVALKPFKIAGRRYEPGAVLLRNCENPTELDRFLGEAAADDLGLAIQPVDTALSEEGPDLGGRKFKLLEPPRIAVASQWPIATTSFGSTWFMLDARLKHRCSPIHAAGLNRIDLRKYNVIVLPHAQGTESLSGVIGEAARRKLRSWVEAGGTLVAMGGSAAFVAGKERGLSAVRLRRDVLTELAVYDEAVQRERAAQAVMIDPIQVWGGGEPPTSVHTESAGAEAPASPPDEEQDHAKGKSKEYVEKLKRDDRWQRLFRPSGVIAAADVNPEHWLCFGAVPIDPVDAGAAPARLAVPISGSYAYLSKHPVATPCRLAGEQHLRLSGLLWPEARRRWANSAYATVERVGHGQIILFASDPFFRGYWEGTGRLLLNALVLGPGLGTSQPLPW